MRGKCAVTEADVGPPLLTPPPIFLTTQGKIRQPESLPSATNSLACIEHIVPRSEKDAGIIFHCHFWYDRCFSRAEFSLWRKIAGLEALRPVSLKAERPSIVGLILRVIALHYEGNQHPNNHFIDVEDVIESRVRSIDHGVSRNGPAQDPTSPEIIGNIQHQNFNTRISLVEADKITTPDLIDFSKLWNIGIPVSPWKWLYVAVWEGGDIGDFSEEIYPSRLLVTRNIKYHGSYWRLYPTGEP